MSHVKEQSADYQLADISKVLKSADAGSILLETLPVWLSAQTRKSAGRGRSASNTLQYGVQKLRELILELAVHGKLVPQDPKDEPASVLLEKITEEKARLVKQGKIKKQKLLDNLSDNECFFLAPQNWAWARLGNIGFTQTGGTPSKSKKEYFGTDVPFIKPADIYPDRVDYDNEGLSSKGAESLARLAPSGSILMVCIGTIGKCNLVSKNVCFNQQINSITPLSVVSEYLLIALRSNQFQTEAWNRSSSTTIAILNKGKWESIPVPLPPLTEQYRIVKKVDELMALCDKLEQQQTDAVQAHDTLVKVLLDTLTQSENTEDFQQNWRRIAEHFDTLFTTESSIDQLKQTLLQLAVTGKLVPQDPNDEPASVLLERIAEEKVRMLKEGKIKKQKPLSEIPKDEIPFEAPTGWSWARFGQIEKNSYTGLDRGKSQQSKDFPTPYFKMNNILNNGGFDLSSLTAVHASEDEINKYRLQNGDFLFNTRNSRELVGKTCVIDGLPENKHTIFNNNILRTTLAPISAHYIDIWFRSTSGGELLEQKKSNTTNVCAIYQGKLFELICAVPPLAEQHRIVKKVDELMKLYDQLKDRLNQAQTLQQQLADAVTKSSL